MAGFPSARNAKAKESEGKRRVEQSRSEAAGRADARGTVPYKGQPDAYDRAQRRYESGAGARGENQELKSLGEKLFMKMNQKDLKSYKPNIDKRSKVQTASWR
jgi:hypothetical protein